MSKLVPSDAQHDEAGPLDALSALEMQHEEAQRKAAAIRVELGMGR
jgi:hypothetical protein